MTNATFDSVSIAKIINCAGISVKEVEFYFCKDSKEIPEIVKMCKALGLVGPTLAGYSIDANKLHEIGVDYIGFNENIAVVILGPRKEFFDDTYLAVSDIIKNTEGYEVMGKPWSVTLIKGEWKRTIKFKY